MFERTKINCGKWKEISITLRVRSDKEEGEKNGEGDEQEDGEIGR